MKNTYWNHRVILDTDKNGSKFFSIRGVHYKNKPNEAENPIGWDSDPLTLTFDYGDSPTEYLQALMNACIKPVLVVEGDKLVQHSERPAEMIINQLFN